MNKAITYEQLVATYERGGVLAVEELCVGMPRAFCAGCDTDTPTFTDEHGECCAVCGEPQVVSVSLEHIEYALVQAKGAIGGDGELAVFVEELDKLAPHLNLFTFFKKV